MKLPMIKKLPGQKLNKKGFTLVELLVVISIIAILSVIGITVFQGQQKNARDARRRADIESIAQAMEAQKTSGSTTYKAIKDNFFSAGKIPVDPTNTSSTSVDNACGFGGGTVCRYCVRSAVGQCADADTPVAEGAPGDVATWTVCANLEAGEYFCRSNAQ